MNKKRSRESYETIEQETVENGKSSIVQNINNSKIKNIKQDTEAITERTINILMNSSKNSNQQSNKVNSNTVKDVEFTNLNPNIPSDYFSCSECTSGSCRSCDSNKRQLRECPSCYNKMCGYCAHYCEGCNEIVCSSCCVTNYDQTYNIDYCIDCNYSHK